MSQMYNVDCSNCGKSLDVFSNKNSGFTTCPNCKEKFSWKEGFDNCWEYSNLFVHKCNLGTLSDTDIHPLLNDESKHYEMLGGVQAIELMEQMFTVEELKAWAKLTAMKYRLRIGDKDTPDKEIKKIKTFEAYYKYLEEK